jgi:hypothetical protein
MSIGNLTSATNYFPQYQSGRASAASRNAVQGLSASQSAASTGADQVTVTNAARSLQAQDASGTQSGSSSVVQEEQLLTTLTDKSLAALGIISAADESGTQITFNSVSYNVSASASVTQQSHQSSGQAYGASNPPSAGSQSSAQFSSAQDATFIGEGHIVTADGRSFEFQIELQLDQSATAAGTGNTTSAASASGAGSSRLPQQQSMISNVAGANPEANLSVGNTGVLTSNPVDSQASQSSTSPIAINWDAILKQTKTLFDLLDSLATPGLAPAAAPPVS